MSRQDFDLVLNKRKNFSIILLNLTKFDLDYLMSEFLTEFRKFNYFSVLYQTSASDSLHLVTLIIFCFHIKSLLLLNVPI